LMLDAAFEFLRVSSKPYCQTAHACVQVISFFVSAYFYQIRRGSVPL
jgi:hypothetical protein